MSASGPRGGLRADAQRNRERILTAAGELLRETGELRLNAVAKACGVGQGTLYRHFPTREDLLAEVYRRDVEELVSVAPQLLSTLGPLDALAAWFDRVAAYTRVKRGVFAAVEAGTWQDLAAHSLGPIGSAVEVLLAAGRADGSIRTDVRAQDVIVLISWLARVDDAELAARGPVLLSVLLDGLRARTPAGGRRPDPVRRTGHGAGPAALRPPTVDARHLAVPGGPP